jgi:Di-haem oxidoreductase, putative peroxidase
VGRASFMVTAVAAVAALAYPASAELGSDIPTDAELLAQRIGEAIPPGPMGSGIFDIASPEPGTVFKPVSRVRRDKFGVVGPFMPNGLQPEDLDALVYPDTTPGDREKLLEGMKFFTTFHTAAEGLGPINNQPACIGCHLNTAEAVKSRGLLGPKCPGGSTCASNVTRAARSTPTNFAVTSLNPFEETGGGLPPDNLDAIFNTGKTAAFTIFGDFSNSLTDTALGSIGFFDPLDGTTHPVIGTTSPWSSQPFGGFVQHVRPSIDGCVPKPIPPVSFDTNLTSSNPNGFRRSVGERAGPPYIGRGLMEAVPTADITANADPSVENGYSSLGNFSTVMNCPSTGCISGKANIIPRNFAVNTSGNNAGTVTGFVGGVGRFGLRANGVEILQFIVGGLQGELSFTSLLNPAEINFPTLFRSTGPTTEPAACAAALSEMPGQPVDLNKLEVHLSTPFSERNFLRNTAPPEFGGALLDVLKSPDLAKPRHEDSKGNTREAKVRRGAELFGIDLVAFANRTIGGPMPAGGDGRDDNAINQSDRKLNCVGCHTPVQKTGQSPADVGADHLSYVWAPIFTDLLLHKMPLINAEREASMPRDVVVISRLSAKDMAEDEDRDDAPGHAKRRIFDTFDLPRNLADDAFTNQKATAEGSEFRTAPLMGLGRIGPPFLHDARVYLSKDTVNGNALAGKAPAGTVTTNSELTNTPLVVRSVDDAILAAIELHDLPAPDDKRTPRLPGAGCPVPDEVTNIIYGESRKDAEAVICPAYDSATSQINRSDAREVILRFRELSSDDQQAMIEFLKQL